MPQGIEVYTASGQLHFQGTDRLMRFLGAVDPNKQSGSVSDARLANGIPVVLDYWEDSYFMFPASVVLSGTTITWTWSGTISVFERAAGRIVYGIY